MRSWWYRSMGYRLRISLAALWLVLGVSDLAERTSTWYPWKGILFLIAASGYVWSMVSDKKKLKKAQQDVETR